MRTLCIACHSDVTKAQCAERRLTRAKAKKQLKAVMNGLKDVQNNEETDANVKVCSQSTNLFLLSRSALFVFFSVSGQDHKFPRLKIKQDQAIYYVRSSASVSTVKFLIMES